MRFEQIGELTTITFDMDTLHALALICKEAVDCGVDGVKVELFYATFTLATMIARTHADIGEPMRASVTTPPDESGGFSDNLDYCRG